MTSRSRSFAASCAPALAALVLLWPVMASAQSSSSTDRWIHIRVVSSDNRGETVRVNVPLDMAEKVLPAINKDRLHGGKVRINEMNCDGVDIKALLDAVRTAKDGEFVTVEGTDADVKVAKQAGYLLIHATDKSGTHIHHRHRSSDEASKDERPEKSEKAVAAGTRESKVEVKVPMKVIDALFSAGKDELDIVAALRALSSVGDTELVSVKSDDNTVRVWLDSKNVTD
jgi:hypothetical protein